MPRVKRGVAAHKRHKRVLKDAEGYWGTRSRLIKTASDAVEKGWKYAFRDRKQRKRQFRSLWIVRINAAAREHGLSYSRLIHGLGAAGVRRRPQEPRGRGGRRPEGLRGPRQAGQVARRLSGRTGGGRVGDDRGARGARARGGGRPRGGADRPGAHRGARALPRAQGRADRGAPRPRRARARRARPGRRGRERDARSGSKALADARREALESGARALSLAERRLDVTLPGAAARAGGSTR